LPPPPPVRPLLYVHPHEYLPGLLQHLHGLIAECGGMPFPFEVGGDLGRRPGTADQGGIGFHRVHHDGRLDAALHGAVAVGHDNPAIATHGPGGGRHRYGMHTEKRGRRLGRIRGVRGGIRIQIRIYDGARPFLHRGGDSRGGRHIRDRTDAVRGRSRTLRGDRSEVGLIPVASQGVRWWAAAHSRPVGEGR
jgi:hypothetical protein